MNEVPTEGEKFLEVLWWDVMDELRELAVFAEGPQHRIAAADVLLRYYGALNQGINAPFIPAGRPQADPEDSDDE